MPTVIHFVKKHYLLILVLALLIVHIFFRFYDMENRNQFTWDQVENAWAAKNILIEHRYPLVGMVAKLNSGFSIGPLYYYLITPFYWIFNLDPVASGIFAGLSSIFTFFVIYFVTKKIFNSNVALIAVFLHTFSMYIINFDRIQWPVNFITPVSFLIFYFLYRILLGSAKHILFLAIALGFAFHVHFTSIFYVIAILLCIPFFPKTKSAIGYSFGSIFLFVIFLLPNIAVELIEKESGSKNMFSYVQTYYHGFHFRRVLQIAYDAFIEFEGLLTFKFLRLLEFFAVPAFLFLEFKSNDRKRKKYILTYLILLWIFIPWFAFATYSGEISNYYFSMTRPIAVLIFAYILFGAISYKYVMVKLAAVIALVIFAVYNTQIFFSSQYQGLAYHRAKVAKAIRENKTINFTEGDPDSYLYYIYTRSK